VRKLFLSDLICILQIIIKFLKLKLSHVPHDMILV